MVIDRRKLLVFAAASALRLILFFAFPSLPVLLTGRVEISTPVTSFKRCKFLRMNACHVSLLMIIIFYKQCKKVYSFTRTTSLLMMEVYSTRQAPSAYMRITGESADNSIRHHCYSRCSP